MKRKGYIYETMSNWDNICKAEHVALKNKSQNYGISLHKKQRIKNLVEIQKSVIDKDMRTGEYKHLYLISGQGKMRRISKLYFHPSHILHLLLVLATQEYISKSLIDDTFASRIGYGQHRCAKRLNKWVLNNYKEYKWYLQIDVKKYYENIRHLVIRDELKRRFKDREYIDAYMETVEHFSSNGVSIPLGIRPSQVFGNLALNSVDRFIKEKLRIKFYARYLDDAVFLLKSKAECWKVWNIIKSKIEQLGFSLHEPVVKKVEKGINFMGYITYPKRGLFIRKSNKVAWLKRRHGVTNKRRLTEIDSAFYGMVLHGNKHCKRLYKKYKGVLFKKFTYE